MIGVVGAHIKWGSPLVNSEHETLDFFDVQICAFSASDYGDVSIYVKKQNKFRPQVTIKNIMKHNAERLSDKWLVKIKVFCYFHVFIKWEQMHMF